MQPVWICLCWSKFFEDAFENTQWRKVKQMQPVWICLCVIQAHLKHLKMHIGKSQTNAIDVTMHPLSMGFEETFENTHWRKTKQMQPVWLCLFSGRQIEETYENAQQRKVTQMQSVWLCIVSGRRLEETFENAQWREVKQVQPIWLCILWSILRTHLITHSGEKPNKCNVTMPALIRVR